MSMLKKMFHEPTHQGCGDSRLKAQTIDHPSARLHTVGDRLQAALVKPASHGPHDRLLYKKFTWNHCLQGQVNKVNGDHAPSQQVTSKQRMVRADIKVLERLHTTRRGHVEKRSHFMTNPADRCNPLPEHFARAQKLAAESQ